MTTHKLQEKLVALRRKRFQDLGAMYRFSDRNLSVDNNTRKRIRFDPVVQVRNTLSRRDMPPDEKFNYWQCKDEDEYMTPQVLKMMTDRWKQRREAEEDKMQWELAKQALPPSQMIGHAIKQRLPSHECQGQIGYTYTVGIKA